MILLLITLLLLPDTPDTLTLGQAYNLAHERFPLENEIEYQERIHDLNIRNLDAGWLPGVSLSGLAQYQSDVTEIDMDFPGIPNGADFPSQPRDRYQVALDLEQRLYDGGRTGSQKELEHRKSERAKQEVRVRQHELRDRINEAWFAIRTLRARQNALEVSHSDLDERLVEMDSQIEHGVLPESARDAIRAEQLRLHQQRRRLMAGERAAIGILSELLVTRLPDDIVLQLPEVPDELPEPQFSTRPEAALIEAHRAVLAGREEMVTATYRPTVAAFGQAAYGRPGLNLFEDDFQPWFVLGVRARWSVWNWRTDHRERRILHLNRQIVDNEEQVFQQNMTMALQEDIRQIAELREIIREDEEIIALHERIVSDAASRLENGTITASEYIRELGNRRRAEINREQHRIELAKYWQNYIIKTGNQNHGKDH